MFGLNPEDAGPSTQVALSELLKSGVTTITDLSMAREGWVDDLAKTGMRAVLCPMMRQGVWFTKNGHVVDYAWDEKAGEKAFEASMKTIDEAIGQLRQLRRGGLGAEKVADPNHGIRADRDHDDEK